MIKLNKWMEQHHTKHTKTQYVGFRNKLNLNLSIKYNNTIIERTNSCKYLGFVIDDKLN